MKRYIQLRFVLILVIILIIIFAVQDYHTLRKNDRKYILYWTPFWWHEDFEVGFGDEPFENCEYTNCFATNNRNFMEISEFDAVIFHASIYDPKIHGKPPRRTANQAYIFCNMEAPVYIAPNFSQYDSFYNWTMTYRFDSDIVSRHGQFVEEESNYTLPSVAVIQKKAKLIAWFVSHCKTSSQREVLVAELQRFLPVDVYGLCGPLACEKTQRNELSSPKCYDMLEEDYKFYLSFENSLCKDYSTEKLYNALRKNVVPIVYGAGDYNMSAPPGSVINVADFETVEQLADHLWYLHENATAYLEYFHWKKRYKIAKVQKACEICRKLNLPQRTSIYHNLLEWSKGTRGEICKIGSDLPNILRNAL
ncbi:hypothetical protein PPYR_14737 [Photinus pyralis]|uniref:Fucosyltransferase n=2 Tax=Photinus pyralis TaxID=7054 RepID=A0A5N4A690_PHOPY|nr:alpha-(1,3)-fucosyltransferase C-like isoform X1 [Photinus pyralis]KAB0792778.1 hypothetical protein PPYR_14737 [Photinus pyralis]